MTMIVAVTFCLLLLLIELVGATTINHALIHQSIVEIPPIAFAKPIDFGLSLERYKFRDRYCPCTQHPHQSLQQYANDASSERRRDVISSTIIYTHSLLTLSFPWAADADENTLSYRRITSPRRIGQYIHKLCNSIFLSSVIESDYNFLYRGLSSDESEAIAYNNHLSAIVITDEPYDLLDPDTYNSIEAVAYFRGLENEMVAHEMPLKPSNSHLATTCPKAVAQWGRAASIWPLGEKGVEFAWMADGGLFWNSDERGFRRKKKNIVVYDGKSSGLSIALQGEREIMFRADNGFIAVPAELDDELRALLREMQT